MCENSFMMKTTKRVIMLKRHTFMYTPTQIMHCSQYNGLCMKIPRMSFKTSIGLTQYLHIKRVCKCHYQPIIKSCGEIVIIKWCLRGRVDKWGITSNVKYKSSVPLATYVYAKTACFFCIFLSACQEFLTRIYIVIGLTGISDNRNIQ